MFLSQRSYLPFAVFCRCGLEDAGRKSGDSPGDHSAVEEVEGGESGGVRSAVLGSKCRGYGPYAASTLDLTTDVMYHSCQTH